ncbi:MAG: 4-(cytidine 5'-diphospho)-2-C-methyl-D-erythritol kinase [Actinomycetota bacterium]
MSEPIVRRAYGKINVFLRVLGRREDGFHDIETLILPVSIFDTVRVELAAGLSLELEGDPEVLAALEGADRDANLALTAARALAEEADIDLSATGARIMIEKRIPVGGGMAGGSADAASVLRALDGLWMCGFDDHRLREIGARIGSDVPAMLVGGPVVAQGRGEILHQVHATATPWIVKSLDFQVSAADAYGWWDEDGARSGPDGGTALAALETGATGSLGATIFNDLEAGILARHPEVGRVRDALVEAGAEAAFVSGSGPTVVALAPHVIHADKIAERVPGSVVVMGPPG